MLGAGGSSGPQALSWHSCSLWTAFLALTTNAGVWFGFFIVVFFPSPRRSVQIVLTENIGQAWEITLGRPKKSLVANNF